MPREDFYASLFGATYSACMERPRLGRFVGRLVWGGDIEPYYESMGAVAERRSNPGSSPPASRCRA
jgi:hypothetical protein